jgi:formate hydrogenlyase subunit 4
MIACLFLPWGMVPLRPELSFTTLVSYAVGAAGYALKLAFGCLMLALFETSIAKMRVFRVPTFLGAALMLGLLGALLLFVSRGL